MSDRTYCVYVLASRSRNLYTGVTNNLARRMIEHRKGLVPGFTTKYKIFRLVHFEQFTDIQNAIAREKEIEGWRREKKIWLIEKQNPRWDDLAAEFFMRRERELEKYAERGQPAGQFALKRELGSKSRAS